VPPVAAPYEPPEGIAPAEAAVLVENRMESRAISATIMDLANRGYIKLELMEEIILGYTSTDYTLTLLQSRFSWEELAGFEQVVLSSLFPLGTMICHGSAKTTLSWAGPDIVQATPIIEREIHRSLESKGRYETTLDWKSMPSQMIPGIFVIFLFFFLQVIEDIGRSEGPLAVFFGLSIWLALLIAFLGKRRSVRKTTPGSIKRAECRSFKHFLESVDGDRLRRMPPATVEKYLPYAMAFGVEHHWSKAFQDLTYLFTLKL